MARYFKYILTFILLISSLGGYGQQMYDGSGSLLGRYDNGKLYNRSGAYEGQINSQRFYSRSGSYLGNESNGKYYDYSGAYIGYTDSGRYYDKSGSLIGYIRGDFVYSPLRLLDRKILPRPFPCCSIGLFL